MIRLQLHSAVQLTRLTQVDFHRQRSSDNVVGKALIDGLVSCKRFRKDQGSHSRLNGNSTVVTTWIEILLVHLPPIPTHSQQTCVALYCLYGWFPSLTRTHVNNDCRT